MKYIDICVLSGAMTGESALAPDGGQEITTHTPYLFAKKIKGPG
jgi:hypothetical protein